MESKENEKEVSSYVHFWPLRMSSCKEMRKKMGIIASHKYLSPWSLWRNWVGGWNIDCKYVNLDKLIPIYVKPLKKYWRKQAWNELHLWKGPHNENIVCSYRIYKLTVKDFLLSEWERKTYDKQPNWAHLLSLH